MKRFNKGEWIGFILLVGWALYLLYLLTKGSIVSFIHPKRIPLMWGTLIGILVLAFYQSTKLFTIPSRKAVYHSYLPIGLVLLCGVFTLTAKETDRISDSKPQMLLTQQVNNEERKGVMSSSVNKNETIQSDEAKPETITSETKSVEPDITTSKKIVSSDNKNLKGSSNEIILDDENYTEILADIEQNPNEYMGKKIKLEGFVYRDEQFEKNDFVVARMFMVCCAADAQVTGLMATWDKSSTLNDKQWVRVEGVLKTQTYEIEGQKSLIPMIHIVSVAKIQTPDNQYVYY